jgi:imidazole glycerol-phosphate synthase subunit HisF
MVKKRLVVSLLVRDGLIVQSFDFKRYLPIGRPKFPIEHVSRWDVDEIVLLDMSASRNKSSIDTKLVEMISKYCYVPLTVGGGIKNIEDAAKLIRAGADKISINHMAIKNPSLISELADNFGSQAVIVSIDSKKHNQNYRVFSHLDSRKIDISPKLWAKKCEDLGAGEIFLNSVDRDGSRKGYDLKLIKDISLNVKIPVIACGGVGKFSHFSEGIKNGASAVAAANIFHHTEHSTILAKASLLRDNVDVRLDSDATYNFRDFDENGRLLMMNSEQLEKIEFKKNKYRFL